MAKEQRNFSIKNVTMNDGVSFIDILRFFRVEYKSIFIGAIGGLAIAIVYLVFAPKKYEATAQIFIAPVGVVSDIKNKANALYESEGVNLFVLRLRSRTSISHELLTTCGYKSEDINAPNKLLSSIKLSVPKSIASVLEAKVMADSPELASACANELFQQIGKFRATLTAPLMEDAGAQLIEYEAQLKIAKELILRADKSNLGISATYLSTRDEIHFLANEIKELRSTLTNIKMRSTYLLSPVYVDSNPSSPKKRLAIILGLLAGLVIGIFAALVRQYSIRHQP